MDLINLGQDEKYVVNELSRCSVTSHTPLALDSFPVKLPSTDPLFGCSGQFNFGPCKNKGSLNHSLKDASLKTVTRCQMCWIH